MKRMFLMFALLAAFSISAMNTVSAQTTVLFDGNMPFGAQGFFSFGDFDVTDTGTSVIIDNSAGSTADGQGLFGGFGSNAFTVIDFDPLATDLTVEYQFLAGDMTDFFNFVLSDIDDIDSAQDNQFVFQGAAGTLIPDGSGFFTQTIPLSATPVFQQTSFSFDDEGDDIFNPGLREIQIQSGFGSEDPFVFEVRRIEITTVPEPSVVALLLCAAPALSLRRRRR